MSGATGWVTTLPSSYTKLIRNTVEMSPPEREDDDESGERVRSWVVGGRGVGETSRIPTDETTEMIVPRISCVST